MSRLGKMAITIADKVEVSVSGDTVKVKGPKGELTQVLPPTTSIQIEGAQLTVQSDGKHGNAKAFHGLARSLIQNMVTGVSDGWSKTLELVGIGYRAEIKGQNLTLSLGYSHPVEMKVPEGLSVEVGGKKKELVTITGADRQLLGEFAANVRSKRPPEPYKGKGVRYSDEQVRLKAGKRVGA